MAQNLSRVLEEELGNPKISATNVNSFVVQCVTDRLKGIGKCNYSVSAEDKMHFYNLFPNDVIVGGPVKSHPILAHAGRKIYDMMENATVMNSSVALMGYRLSAVKAFIDRKKPIQLICIHSEASGSFTTHVTRELNYCKTSFPNKPENDLSSIWFKSLVNHRYYELNYKGCRVIVFRMSVLAEFTREVEEFITPVHMLCRDTLTDYSPDHFSVVMYKLGCYKLLASMFYVPHMAFGTNWRSDVLDLTFERKGDKIGIYHQRSSSNGYVLDASIFLAWSNCALFKTKPWFLTSEILEGYDHYVFIEVIPILTDAKLHIIKPLTYMMSKYMRLFDAVKFLRTGERKAFIVDREKYFTLFSYVTSLTIEGFEASKITKYATSLINRIVIANTEVQKNWDVDSKIFFKTLQFAVLHACVMRSEIFSVIAQGVRLGKDGGKLGYFHEIVGFVNKVWDDVTGAESRKVLNIIDSFSNYAPDHIYHECKWVVEGKEFEVKPTFSVFVEEKKEVEKATVKTTLNEEEAVEIIPLGPTRAELLADIAIQDHDKELNAKGFEWFTVLADKEIRSLTNHFAIQSTNYEQGFYEMHGKLEKTLKNIYNRCFTGSLLIENMVFGAGKSQRMMEGFNYKSDLIIVNTRDLREKTLDDLSKRYKKYGLTVNIEHVTVKTFEHALVGTSDFKPILSRYKTIYVDEAFCLSFAMILAYMAAAPDANFVLLGDPQQCEYLPEYGHLDGIQQLSYWMNLFPKIKTSRNTYRCSGELTKLVRLCFPAYKVYTDPSVTHKTQVKLIEWEETPKDAELYMALSKKTVKYLKEEGIDARTVRASQGQSKKKVVLFFKAHDAERFGKSLALGVVALSRASHELYIVEVDSGCLSTAIVGGKNFRELLLAYGELVEEQPKPVAVVNTEAAVSEPVIKRETQTHMLVYTPNQPETKQEIEVAPTEVSTAVEILQSAAVPTIPLPEFLPKFTRGYESFTPSKSVVPYCSIRDTLLGKTLLLIEFLTHTHNTAPEVMIVEMEKADYVQIVAKLFPEVIFTIFAPNWDYVNSLENLVHYKFIPELERCKHEGITGVGLFIHTKGVSNYAEMVQAFNPKVCMLLMLYRTDPKYVQGRFYLPIFLGEEYVVSVGTNQMVTLLNSVIVKKMESFLKSYRGLTFQDPTKNGYPECDYDTASALVILHNYIALVVPTIDISENPIDFTDISSKGLMDLIREVVRTYDDAQIVSVETTSKPKVQIKKKQVKIVVQTPQPKQFVSLDPEPEDTAEVKVAVDVAVASVPVPFNFEPLSVEVKTEEVPLKDGKQEVSKVVNPFNLEAPEKDEFEEVELFETTTLVAKTETLISEVKQTKPGLIDMLRKKIHNYQPVLLNSNELAESHSEEFKQEKPKKKTSVGKFLSKVSSYTSRSRGNYSEVDQCANVYQHEPSVEVVVNSNSKPTTEKTSEGAFNLTLAIEKYTGPIAHDPTKIEMQALAEFQFKDVPNTSRFDPDLLAKTVNSNRHLNNVQEAAIMGTDNTMKKRMKIKTEILQKNRKVQTTLGGQMFDKIQTASSGNQSVTTALHRNAASEDKKYKDFSDAMVISWADMFKEYFITENLKVSDIHQRFSDKTVDIFHKYNDSRIANMEPNSAVSFVIREFLKTQKRVKSEEAPYQKKPGQPISAWATELARAFSVYFDALENLLITNLKDFVFYAPGKTHEEQEAFVRRCMKLIRNLASDGKEWDSRQNKLTLKICIEVYKWLFRIHDKGFECTWLEEFFSHPALLREYQLIRWRIKVLGNGYTYENEDRLLSGSPSTLFSNCLLRMIVTMVVVARKFIRALMVKGDDDLVDLTAAITEKDLAINLLNDFFPIDLKIQQTGEGCSILVPEFCKELITKEVCCYDPFLLGRKILSKDVPNERSFIDYQQGVKDQYRINYADKEKFVCAAVKGRYGIPMENTQILLDQIAAFTQIKYSQFKREASTYEADF